MASGLDIRQLAKSYGFLPYMVERYFQIFRDEKEVVEFLQACSRSIKPSIRVNTLITTPATLQARLLQKGFDLQQVGDTRCIFRVNRAPYPLGATTEYLLGHYYIQGVPSALCAVALAPQPYETVADMCAAPGGKTTHIAQLMENQGVVLAFDLSRVKMRALRSHVSRMGVTNVVMMRMDAAKMPELGLEFDKILLDAPCTGEGLIPIDPSRKTSRLVEDIMVCARRQSGLVDAAVQCLKPGGSVLYSTCSIAPEENEFVVQDAIVRHGLQVVDTGIQMGREGLTRAFGRELDGSLKLARRFYPHTDDTEGFFICKLTR